MKEKEIKFKTPKEMVNWLMDNENTELNDIFGRKWKYNKYYFYYRDIGTTSKFVKGINGLHLCGTILYQVKGN